jgi:hypothetical protein
MGAPVELDHDAIRFGDHGTGPLHETPVQMLRRGLIETTQLPPNQPNTTRNRPNLRYQVLADFATLRITVTGKQLDAALIDAH